MTIIDTNLTENQQRLLTFAERFSDNGNWHHLGEDALEDATVLQDLGYVEISIPGGDDPIGGPIGPMKYRLSEQHQPEAALPDVAVVTREDSGEVVAVLILKGGYNSIKAHRALKVKYDIPDNVYLNSRLIGTEEAPE